MAQLVFLLSLRLRGVALLLRLLPLLPKCPLLRLLLLRLLPKCPLLRLLLLRLLPKCPLLRLLLLRLLPLGSSPLLPSHSPLLFCPSLLRTKPFPPGTCGPTCLRPANR